MCKVKVKKIMGPNEHVTVCHNKAIFGCVVGTTHRMCPIVYSTSDSKIRNLIRQKSEGRSEVLTSRGRGVACNVRSWISMNIQYCMILMTSFSFLCYHSGIANVLPSLSLGSPKINSEKPCIQHQSTESESKSVSKWLGRYLRSHFSFHRFSSFSHL